MIAVIDQVWRGEKVTTVIAHDCDTGRRRTCFAYMPEQQIIAALCARVSKHGEIGVTRIRPDLIGAKVVLTVKPKTRWGFQIEAAELLDEADVLPSDTAQKASAR